MLLTAVTIYSVCVLLGQSTWRVFSREVSWWICGSVEISCQWCKIW